MLHPCTLAFGVVCCFAVFIPAVVDSTRTLYKIKSKDGKVCAMLEVEFNLTISARLGHQLFRRIAYRNSDDENVATGSCYDDMILHLKDGVNWNFRMYLDQPTTQYMKTRTVTFVPHKLFGDVVPSSSNKTLVFRNPWDVKIGTPSESYSCDVEDREHYSLRSLYGDRFGVIYPVYVDVKFIQIQFRRIRDGKFSDARKCEIPH